MDIVKKTDSEIAEIMGDLVKEKSLCLHQRDRQNPVCNDCSRSVG